MRGWIVSLVLVLAPVAASAQTRVIPPSSGAATWGGIGGTLADQSDLQAALDRAVVKDATNVITASASASTPVMRFGGAPFTGGTSTTTKPYWLIEPTGCAPTSNAWPTVGTYLGINQCSGATLNFLNFQVNGAQKFAMSVTGAMTWPDGLGVDTMAISPNPSLGSFVVSGNWFVVEGKAFGLSRWAAGWRNQTFDRYYGAYNPSDANTAQVWASMDSIGSGGTNLKVIGLQAAMRVRAAGNSGTALTLDMGASATGGDWQQVTLTGSATLTLSNVYAGMRSVLQLTVDGTGGYTTPAFAGCTYSYDGGSPPSLDMTANKVHYLEVYSPNGSACFLKVVGGS